MTSFWQDYWAMRNSKLSRKDKFQFQLFTKLVIINLGTIFKGDLQVSGLVKTSLSALEINYLSSWNIRKKISLKECFYLKRKFHNIAMFQSSSKGTEMKREKELKTIIATVF